jgi:hypothetical protein
MRAVYWRLSKAGIKPILSGDYGSRERLLHTNWEELYAQKYTDVRALMVLSTSSLVQRYRRTERELLVLRLILIRKEGRCSN